LLSSVFPSLCLSPPSSFAFSFPSLLFRINFIPGEKGCGKSAVIAHLGKKWPTALASKQSIAIGKQSSADTQDYEVPSTGDKKIRLQIWNFRGEPAYENTYQFYFSSRAIFLVLFNGTKPFAEQAAELWIQKIVARVNNPRIIICATHADHWTDRETTNQRITEISEKFLTLFRDVVQSIDVIGVSVKTGENIRKLRSLVQMLVSMHRRFGENIPGTTFLFESATREHVQQISDLPPVMTLQNLRSLAHNCGILAKDVPKNVEYLREDCQLFFTPQSPSFVVLHGPWLSTALSALVSGGRR
jgi:GTPase SAR1 family protein